MTSTRAIRNIAIIAHVDHGKTTMVDKLLRAAGKASSFPFNELLSRLPFTTRCT